MVKYTLNWVLGRNTPVPPKHLHIYNSYVCMQEQTSWDFIEQHLELSEQTKKDIELSKKEYENGNFVTLEEVKKELGF